MLDLKKVAVTGGLSSGKSTFCRELQKLGAYYISADQITHRLLCEHSKIIHSLVELLGDHIVVDGKIDRSKIAECIFGSTQLLKQVEAIVHPAVDAEIKHIYKQIRASGQYLLFVVEVPLLFEARLSRWYNKVVTILTDKKEAMCRYRLQTGHSMQEYERRMRHQMDPEIKAKRSHIVIKNNRSIQELQEQARTLYAALTH